MNRTTLIAIYTAISFGLFAQDELKIEKLAIFTDGNSYVVKGGVIESVNKKFTLEDEQLPVPRFGTFQTRSSDGTLTHVTSKLKKKEPPIIEENLKSILSDNIGKRIKIKTRDTSYIGKIRKLIPKYLIIDEDKPVFIDLHTITTFEFIDTYILNDQTRKSNNVKSKKYDAYGRPIKQNNKNTILTFHFKNDGPKNISLSYLQKGVSWNPNYRLNLIDKKEAVLELQAELINDGPKLHNTRVELIEGTPSFKYHEHLTDLIDFNNILDPFHDKQKNNGSYYRSPSVLDEVIITKPKPETKFHDFQIHYLDDVSLEKHSRAIFNINSYKIPYKHIFECHLVKQDFDKDPYRYSKIEEKKNTVFHSLQIENTTTALLGKGSIFIFDSNNNVDRPLAQSTLKYLPKSGRGTIKLTENHEVEINRNERILNRDTEIFEFLDYEYYRTEMEGTIKVVNYNKKQIELHMDAQIDGEIHDQNLHMEIISQKQPFFSPNYKNKVKWILILPPGTTQEIKYIYEVYIKT